MKKILSVLLILLTVVTITGCGKENKESENNKQNSSEMSKEEITEKIYSVNNDLTSFWNNVVIEVRYYAETGKNSIGEASDIDFIVSNMDKYYTKCVDNKKFIDSLSNDYSNIINSYDKAMEQAKIIYDNIKKETPKANSKLSYKENIELFHQYQDKFYELANDEYLNN